MKNLIPKIKLYVLTHKIISAVAIIIIISVGYWGYDKFTSTAGETQYITTIVEKGTIVSSVTASGQVESSNQIDLKANVSGTITYVGVKPGDKVAKGKTLFFIDSKDAQRSIRDAEISLESAKIAFKKFKIQNSSENMNIDLAKSYDDGFNTATDTFLDLPEIMTGLNDMFFKSSINASQWNIDWYEGQVSVTDREEAVIFKKNFSDSYVIARDSYEKTLSSYKLIPRTADGKTIETLITATYNTTELISDSIRNGRNYVDFVVDSIGSLDRNTPSIINTNKISLNTYTSETNSHLTSLLSIQTSIKNYQDAFLNGDLDMQSQLLSLKQKENSLQDLKDKLSDYYVHAPFGGTMASVLAKVGDTASGTLGSIITNQKNATLSMNEVDIAKIKLGEKATVTFDAIEDLSITGTVAEIDTVGTVSQGVVSYNVKIAFDTENDLVKSGMSVSASIITDSKTDTLIVPSSAIKTQGATKYVQMFTVSLLAPATDSKGTPSKEIPNQIPVEIGITDDTNTEIISGLKKGDQIVSRTITSTSNTTAQASSLLGGASTRSSGGGSGNFQMITR